MLRSFLLSLALLTLASSSVYAEKGKECFDSLGVGGTFQTDLLKDGRLKYLWFDYVSDGFNAGINHADELARGKGYSLVLVKTYYQRVQGGKSICENKLHCSERSCYTDGRPAVDVLLADGDGKMLLLEKNSQDKELIAKLTGFMKAAGFEPSKGRWWHFVYTKPLP